MEPFRKFHWDNKLDQIYIKSKELLISKIIEGIYTFDITKKYAFKQIGARDGKGYYLLQQHCNCNSDKALSCCNEGWKLIYADHFLPIKPNTDIHQLKVKLELSLGALNTPRSLH